MVIGIQYNQSQMSKNIEIDAKIYENLSAFRFPVFEVTTKTNNKI